MKAAKQENRNSFTVPNSKLSVKESMDISVYIYIYIYTHIDKVAKREEYFLIILNNECRLSPLLRRKTPEQNNNRQPKKRGKTHTHTHTHTVFTSSQLTFADIIMSRTKRIFS
jgi:hypothetical protein